MKLLKRWTSKTESFFRWSFLCGPLAFLVSKYFLDQNFSSQMSVVMSTLLWMLVWWLFSKLPPALPALVPFVVFTLYQTIPANDLAASVGSPTIMLFLGGFMIAAAIEKWDLHRDFAMLFLKRSQRSINGILLVFIFVSAFASMWISNTATVLILLPVIESLFSEHKDHPETRKMLGYFMLAVAYASSVGGLATIIGSPPNAIAVAFLRDAGREAPSFAAWMRLSLPLALMGSLLLFFFFKFLLKRIKTKSAFESQLLDSVEHTAKNHKLNLSFEKKSVLGILLAAITGWLFVAPLSAFTGLAFTDATVALIGGFLLFVWPTKKRKEQNSSSTLLGLQDLDRLPWATLFLFAGGLALSKGLNSSGWIEWTRLQMTSLPPLPPVFLVFTLVSLGVALTEVMSNTALAALLVPWALSFESIIDIPITNLVMALCFASSLSFMMPVATPPNAIAFGRGHVSLKTMLGLGFILNILFAVLVTVYVSWLMPYLAALA